MMIFIFTALYTEDIILVTKIYVVIQQCEYNGILRIKENT